MMDKRALLKRKLELKKIQLRKMADDRFATYLNYINPVYRRQWFHTLIADKCQDLFEGKINKLMVFMPPQHGKSEIVSRKFPTWAFGKDPTLKIIECWNAYVWPRLITDDTNYFLVSNGIQSIRENGFGRENIPAMMAAVVVISVPLVVLFLLFRKKIMAGVSRGGTKG